MTSIPRSTFVNAVKKVTDDPRIIEQAQQQTAFAVGAWETTDPKTGKPCGCVVGEFIFNVKADRTLDNDAIEDVNREVERTYGVPLQRIGTQIDAAVHQALAEYHAGAFAAHVKQHWGVDDPSEVEIDNVSNLSVWGPVVYIEDDAEVAA